MTAEQINIIYEQLKKIVDNYKRDINTDSLKIIKACGYPKEFIIVTDKASIAELIDMCTSCISIDMPIKYYCQQWIDLYDGIYDELNLDDFDTEVFTEITSPILCMKYDNTWYAVSTLEFESVPDACVEQLLDTLDDIQYSERLLRNQQRMEVEELYAIERDRISSESKQIALQWYLQYRDTLFQVPWLVSKKDKRSRQSYLINVIKKTELDIDVHDSYGPYGYIYALMEADVNMHHSYCKQHNQRVTDVVLPSVFTDWVPSIEDLDNL